MCELHSVLASTTTGTCAQFINRLFSYWTGIEEVLKQLSATGRVSTDLSAYFPSNTHGRALSHSSYCCVYAHGQHCLLGYHIKFTDVFDDLGAS